MRKFILILAILTAGIGLSAQTLIHTDTVTTGDDNMILYKWYHERFVDADGVGTDFKLISRIGLVKEYQLTDTTYTSVMTHYHRVLTQSDSLKNPYGNNYYQAPFVRNYIYSTSEDMKRTLSLFWLLNEPKRLME